MQDHLDRIPQLSNSSSRQIFPLQFFPARFLRCDNFFSKAFFPDPPGGRFFRALLRETPTRRRSLVPLRPVFLRGPIHRPKSPIISANRKSKLAISITRLPALIPRRIRRDRRPPDKSITRQSRKNEPGIPPRQKEDQENKLL